MNKAEIEKNMEILLTKIRWMQEDLWFAEDEYYSLRLMLEEKEEGGLV